MVIDMISAKEKVMSDHGSEVSAVGKRFPFIDLEKALVRAAKLYQADPNGRPMPVSAAFEIWNYSTKSSGGHQGRRPCRP